MKRGLMLIGLIIVPILIVKAWADWDVTDIRIDTKNKKAYETLVSGSYQVTNATAGNGDTIQVSTFVPDGGVLTDNLPDPGYTVLTNQLFSSGFPIVQTITGAITKGIVSSVGVSGMDTTYFDVTTNQQVNGVN